MLTEVAAPNSSSQQRPGDLFIQEFEGGADAYFDVSVINIVAPTHLSRASKGPLEGSQFRFDAKIKKYWDQLGNQMKPLVVILCLVINLPTTK
jgi:hypothetical protein